MVAYWIARAKVNDPDAYRRYAEAVPEILADFDARILARGGPFEILEGPEHFHRFVVIEFPDLETAVRAYRSPAYQDARRHRMGGAGEAEIVIVEGVPVGTKN